MAGYADVEDPVALLNRAPDTSGGPTVEDAVREAGFEVQAVDWVWRKVVGESLVDSVIKPITGDFEKIARQAGEWRNVKDALQAVRNNLNVGLTELQPAWRGESADRFRNLIGTKWTLGIEADAQAASLIGLALSKVAEGSKRACDQALKLIKTLVDKLIEAAAMLPIPVVGWGRAVKLVYDGIQIYNAIMQLIEGIKAIIQGAQQVIQGVQQVGTALSKIDDIHDLNDALNVANEAGEGAANIHSGAQGIKDGATQAAGATGDLARHGTSAADNARGLHDERSANTDPSGGNGRTDPGGRTTAQGTDPSARPADPNATRTPVEYRRCDNDPIDVASGEMVLAQTDVTLSGVLPLMLRRTHVSSYRAGGSFGRSWASTLDQRLEFDHDGAVFVADDGMLLVYPEPRTGAAVLPKVGPRWPLTNTGTGYTITVPETGQLLHFPAGDSAVQPLAAILDRNGNRIDFDRDGAGTVTAVRHSGGYHVDVESSGGRVVELRLRTEDGAVVTLVRYGYGAAGQISEVINSSNRALRFEYDAAGRIVQWTDRNDEWYRYFYDADGRCVANQGSGGFLNGTFSYGDRVTRFTDALGHTTVYQLDERHNVVADTTPLGETTTSEWDELGRLRTRTDPLGRTTRYTYDDAGSLTAIDRPDGARLRFEFDHDGRPTTAVDPEGGIRRHEYDERGNLVAVIDPLGATTRYTHNERGHVTSVTDALGNVVRIATNPAGLPVAVTDRLGATTRYSRDQLGRVAALTDPMGGVTRFGWTVEGSLTSRTRPDGATERWVFDGEGNQLEHIDAVGHVVRTEATHFNLPAVEIGPDGGRLEFGYDANLRLVSVTNQQGLIWRYEYDPVGRLVRETDFNGRVVSYAYDAAGQLVERTNGAGETVALTRSLMGDIVERRSGDELTTLRHDGNGKLIWARNAAAELEYRRDALGRVLSETINGATVTSTYDPLGRRTHRSTPTGAQSVWEYDANDNPVRLRIGERTLAFGYNAAGREVERRLDTGARLTQAWDVNQRLIQQSVSGREARSLQQRRYHYHPDSQLAAIEDLLAGERRFQLDPIGRVTGVEATDAPERYTYDLAGNITSASWGREPDVREYQGTLVRNAGDCHYQHDAQGRVVMRQRKRLSRKPDTWRYTWDADDRLVAVVTPDGTRWRYLYDPLGRRIAKLRLGAGESVVERVDFHWDGTVLAEQTSAGQTTTWEFDPGSFRPLTQSERSASMDERFYAIVTDLIGTPTELIDGNGEIAWHGRRTIWGSELFERQRAATPLRFPGQYYDQETELNYNYQRYYDPATARYASGDPMGLAAGAAPHSYVHNPTTRTDPLGLVESDDIVWVDPNTINFSQRTISPNDYAQRMASGDWDWNRDDAALRVMEVNGQLVSYDNRRLDAARDAGVTSVPIQRVNPNDPHPDSTTGKTWGDKFRQRFNDPRNRREGGPVPATGLNERPRVNCP